MPNKGGPGDKKASPTKTGAMPKKFAGTSTTRYPAKPAATAKTSKVAGTPTTTAPIQPTVSDATLSSQPPSPPAAATAAASAKASSPDAATPQTPKAPKTLKDYRDQSSAVSILGRLFAGPIIGFFGGVKDEFGETFKRDIPKIPSDTGMGSAWGQLKSFSIAFFSVVFTFPVAILRGVAGIFATWAFGTEGLTKLSEFINERFKGTLSSALGGVVAAGVGIVAQVILTPLAGIGQYFAGIWNGIKATYYKGESLRKEEGILNQTAGVFMQTAGLLGSFIYESTLGGIVNFFRGVAAPWRTNGFINPFSEREGDFKPKDRNPWTEVFAGSNDLDYIDAYKKDRDAAEKARPSTVSASSGKPATMTEEVDAATRAKKDSLTAKSASDKDAIATASPATVQATATTGSASPGRGRADSLQAKEFDEKMKAAATTPIISSSPPVSVTANPPTISAPISAPVSIASPSAAAAAATPSNPPPPISITSPTPVTPAATATPSSPTSVAGSSAADNKPKKPPVKQGGGAQTQSSQASSHQGKAFASAAAGHASYAASPSPSPSATSGAAAMLHAAASAMPASSPVPIQPQVQRNQTLSDGEREYLRLHNIDFTTNLDNNVQNINLTSNRADLIKGLTHLGIINPSGCSSTWHLSEKDFSKEDVEKILKDIDLERGDKISPPVDKVTIGNKTYYVDGITLSDKPKLQPPDEPAGVDIKPS